MVNQIIAVPSQMPGGLDAQTTTRFGRCPVFTLVSIENDEVKSVKVVSNGGTSAMGGAGPVAVQTIAQEHANCVIGGNYGPNAANALTQAGIASYGAHNGTVKEVIGLYLSNSLPQISGANVASHTGMQ